MCEPRPYTVCGGNSSGGQSCNHHRLRCAQQEKNSNWKWYEVFTGDRMHAFVQLKSDGIINAAIGHWHCNFQWETILSCMLYTCMTRVLSVDGAVCCVPKCIFRADKSKTHANPQKHVLVFFIDPCEDEKKQQQKQTQTRTNSRKETKTNKHGICANENRKTSNNNSETKATKIEKRNMKMIWLCHVRVSFYRISNGITSRKARHSLILKQKTWVIRFLFLHSIV